MARQLVNSLSPKRSASGALKRAATGERPCGPTKVAVQIFFICPTHELHLLSEAMFTVLTIVVSDERPDANLAKRLQKIITVYDWRAGNFERKIALFQVAV